MWPGFPKRLQSALKALCCLAQAGTAMQAATIAERIAVPKAETAKIMQLLVWGGFVTSRRGIKGGFQLVTPPEKITMGAVLPYSAPSRTRLGLPHIAGLTEINGARPAEVCQADARARFTFSIPCYPE